MDDLMNDKQSLVGAILMLASAAMAFAASQDMIENANMWLAMALGMFGALMLLLSLRVSGGGAENVEGMDEVFDVVETLKDMRDQLAEQLAEQSDDE